MEAINSIYSRYTSLDVESTHRTESAHLEPSSDHSNDAVDMPLTALVSLRNEFARMNNEFRLGCQSQERLGFSKV